MKIREYLVQSAKLIPAHADANTRLEIEVLMRYVLGIGRAEFFASLEQDLASEQHRRLDSLVQRRVAGEPLAYITGQREFYGLDFLVNPHVLIPRQETETLVDEVLKRAASRPSQRLLIADVGTGSGAIAVSLACSLSDATVYAIDIDANALAVAGSNSRRHGTTDRVHLIQGDLLSAIGQPVDIIASNPPYISTGELSRLSAEVQREPAHALDGGADGLDIIRRLLEHAPSRLKQGGGVLLEIAPEQLGPVSELARHAFPGSTVSFARDLSNNARVVIVDSMG